MKTCDGFGASTVRFLFEYHFFCLGFLWGVMIIDDDTFAFNNDDDNGKENDDDDDGVQMHLV